MGWWGWGGEGRMAGAMSDVLEAIEEWTGHRSRRDPVTMWRTISNTNMTMSMNTKRLRSWLAAAAALGESLAILDLKGVMPLLPEGWAVWVAGVPTFAALVVHVVKAFGDSLGKLEGEDNR